MKNMIAPEKLALLKQKPVPYAEIAEVLATSEMSATQLCKLVGVEPQSFFRWKNRNSKVNQTVDPIVAEENDFSVKPANGKKKYSPADKLKLIKRYTVLAGSDKAAFLRKFGLYQSDMDRWSSLVDLAAVEALAKRKSRSDKKSPEIAALEVLKKEIIGHEKTITKLAALVVIQKKVSEILDSAE